MQWHLNHLLNWPLLLREKLGHWREQVLQLRSVEGIEQVLVLHQLDLKVLIGLVVVCEQVVNAFEKGGQRAAIVLLLQQEFLLREDLH